MNEKLMKITWKADIERALREIGRPATTSEVFAVIKENRRAEGRKIATHSRHGVRRILLSDFDTVEPPEGKRGDEPGTLFWLPD